MNCYVQPCTLLRKKVEKSLENTFLTDGKLLGTGCPRSAVVNTDTHQHDIMLQSVWKAFSPTAADLTTVRLRLPLILQLVGWTYRTDKCSSDILWPISYNDQCLGVGAPNFIPVTKNILGRYRKVLLYVCKRAEHCWKD